MDDVLTVDLDDLTVGEIEEIEERLDCPFDEIFVAGKPKAKALRVLAYISRKRTDPSFTYEDAGNLKIKVAKSDPQ